MVFKEKNELGPFRFSRLKTDFVLRKLNRDAFVYNGDVSALLTSRTGTEALEVIMTSD
jgi:hypothetical protein